MVRNVLVDIYIIVQISFSAVIQRDHSPAFAKPDDLYDSFDQMAGPRNSCC